MLARVKVAITRRVRRSPQGMMLPSLRHHTFVTISRLSFFNLPNSRTGGVPSKPVKHR